MNTTTRWTVAVVDGDNRPQLMHRGVPTELKARRIAKDLWIQANIAGWPNSWRVLVCPE